MSDYERVWGVTIVATILGVTILRPHTWWAYTLLWSAAAVICAVVVAAPRGE